MTGMFFVEITFITYLFLCTFRLKVFYVNFRIRAFGKLHRFLYTITILRAYIPISIIHHYHYHTSTIPTESYLHYDSLHQIERLSESLHLITFWLKLPCIWEPARVTTSLQDLLPQLSFLFNALVLNIILNYDDSNKF